MMSEGRIAANLAADGGYELTLEREAEGNALTASMTAELARRMQDRPDGAKFIVLSGAGADFCAGRQSPMPPPGEKPSIAQLRARVAEPVLDFYDVVRTVPIPVLAVIRGRAAGVGCALAGLADLAIAAETAVFSIPEMDRDIPPLLVMTALAERVGRTALARLVLTRASIDAAEAVRIGLVGEAVAPEALDEHVAMRRAALAANSLTVLQTVKRFLTLAPDLPHAGRRELAATANAAAVSERYR